MLTKEVGKDVEKLFRQVGKDLRMERIDYYLENVTYTGVIDRLLKEAFLQDKNMESVREFRAYVSDQYEQCGGREPLVETWRNK